MGNKLFNSVSDKFIPIWCTTVLLSAIISFRGVSNAQDNTNKPSTAPLELSTSNSSNQNPQLEKAAFAKKTKKLQIPFIANNGDVYVTDSTKSTDFPTTSGAEYTSYNGYYDVFVSKLDSNLSTATNNDTTCSWSVVHHDSRLTARADCIGPQTDNIRWIYDPDVTVGAIIGPVVGADGTIYYCPKNDTLYALSSSGSLKWIFNIDDKIGDNNEYIYDIALDNDGNIYLSGYRKFIYAIKSDGTLNWKYDHSGDYGGLINIGPDGTIYIAAGFFAGADSKLIALDTDGSLKWTFDSFVPTCRPAIDSDGIVYVARGKSTWAGWVAAMAAINPDGSTKWINQCQSSEGCGYTYFYGYPLSIALGEDNKLYTIETTSGSYLCTYDTEDGSKLSSCRVAGWSDSIKTPALSSSGSIYLSLYSNSNYPFTGSLVEVQNGCVKNTVYTSENGAPSSTVLDNDDNIYFNTTHGSDNGEIICLTSSGEVRWSYEISTSVVDSFAVGNDGVLYVVDGNGKLYAFGQYVPSPTPAVTPSPTPSATPTAVGSPTPTPSPKVTPSPTPVSTISPGIPHIDNISPAFGPSETEITITGVNFGDTQDSSVVNFGYEFADINYWSDTKILATVPSLSPETYSVTVTTINGTSNSVSFLLTKLQGERDFSIKIKPSQQTVVRGSSVIYSVLVESTNGFNEEVTLTAEKLPSETSADFSLNPLSIGKSSDLTITTTDTPLGSHTFRIKGSSNGITHTVKASLLVKRSKGSVLSFQQSFSSEKPLLLTFKYEKQTEDKIEAKVTLWNITGTWIKASLNFSEGDNPVSVKEKDVPYIILLGPFAKKSLGNITFHSGEYLQYNGERTSFEVLAALAIDLFLRGTIGYEVPSDFFFNLYSGNELASNLAGDIIRELLDEKLGCSGSAEKIAEDLKNGSATGVITDLADFLGCMGKIKKEMKQLFTKILKNKKLAQKTADYLDDKVSLLQLLNFPEHAVAFANLMCPSLVPPIDGFFESLGLCNTMGAPLEGYVRLETVQ